MPINIDFLSNVTKFLRGTKQVEDAFDDVADSLDDVVKDGDKGLERLERSFKDATDEAKKLDDELGRIDRNGPRAFKDVADSARDASRDIDRAADAGESGFRRLGDKGAEVSGELRQNLGETFSSFRGDLEDLPQIAQDTLGGLAGSGALGGIVGLAATAAGAAGLGLIIKAFQESGEAAERLKEQAKEWADAYIENGGRVLSAQTVITKAQEILGERFTEAETNAENWGVSLETAVAAMAGSETAIDKVRDSLGGLNEKIEEYGEAKTAPTEEEIQLYLRWNEQLRAGQPAFDELTGAMDQGAKQADIYSNFLADLARETEGAKTEVDEFGDSITELPDGTTIYIDAETGQATTAMEAIENKTFAPKVVPIKLGPLDDYNLRNYRPRTIVVPAKLTVNPSLGGRTMI